MIKKDHGVPGDLASYWIESTPNTDYPPLTGDVRVDTVVLGGGIAGITTAALLKKQGIKVAVVEAARIAKGVTGRTSAEISASQGFLYGHIIGQYGLHDAILCASSNREAVDSIESLARENGIDCEFRRTPEYFYASKSEDSEKLKMELDAYRRVGLPASYVEKAPLPFETYGAIRCDDQAEFHPRKYLLGLASTIPGDGSFIFEKTRALDIKEGEPGRVKTDRGNVIAKDVVVATHYPISNRGRLYEQMDVYRSYVLGFTAEDEMERAMFYSAEMPCHYIRTTETPGGRMTIVGGEDHKVGQVSDTRERYKKLEEFARDRFKIKSIGYSWSTQDNYPTGILSLIGKIDSNSRHVYVATGFRGNGMTYGTLSGMIISDMILGKKSPYMELYDPKHSKQSAGEPEPEEKNNKAADMFTGYKEAVYRDEDGKSHAVSPICAHMGCIVKWNNAELSWDCPCHASRYNYDGKVLHSPTVRDLKKEDAEKK